MKKIFAALLAAVMMLALAACGGDSGKTVDVQKLADDLKDNVPYSTTMIASAVEDLEYKLDPPEGTAIAGYIADGSAYDMIVVAQCASADDAKTLYANTQTYLDDLKREANLYQPGEEGHPQALDLLHSKTIELVVSVPKDIVSDPAHDVCYHVRRGAIDLNVPLLTNARLAAAFINAFCTIDIDQLEIKAWDEYK